MHRPNIARMAESGLIIHIEVDFIAVAMVKIVDDGTAIAEAG